MLTLLLVLRRLIAVIRAVWADRTARGAAISLATLLTLATIFYSVVEGWSVVNSIYFAVVTGLTIGYGDLVPQHSISKVFTVFYAVLAVGLFVTLGTAVRGWLNAWGVVLAVGIAIGTVLPLLMARRHTAGGLASLPAAAALVLAGGFMVRTAIVFVPEAIAP